MTSRLAASTQRKHLVGVKTAAVLALHHGDRAYLMAGVQPEIHAAIGAVGLRAGFKPRLAKKRLAHRFKAPPRNRRKHRRAPFAAFC
jgi:hypothetical protein